MQLKYSFKKEWAHFVRTGRLLGLIAAIFSFALSTPLMMKMCAVILEMVDMNTDSMTASVTGSASGMDSALGVGMDDILDLYSDAGMIYVETITSFCGLSLLIVMLILMAAAGGEQKKRATIVPMCSGLEYKNYLIPKFVIYPLSTFAVTLVSGLAAGALCNALFTENKVSGDVMLLSTVMVSVYMLFITCVYLSVGLCMSRPGVATVLVFIGQSLLQSIFLNVGLIDYNPFTLISLPSGMVLSEGEGFFLAESMPSIIVGMAISVVVAVLMYFLALGVLNAKRIDNTEEEKPEF